MAWMVASQPASWLAQSWVVPAACCTSVPPTDELYTYCIDTVISHDWETILLQIGKVKIIMNYPPKAPNVRACNVLYAL